MKLRNLQGAGIQVPSLVLASLMRVATACAHLCGRVTVTVCPDVCLAVRLMESTLLLKVKLNFQELIVNCKSEFSEWHIG